MNIFNVLIKSDYVRAQILAFVRHLVTAAGVSLIAKGYADDSLVQAAAGLATGAVGFWLASLDVKKVDEKITVALNTPPPVLSQPTPQGLSPEQEREYTALLNKLQTIKPGNV